MISTSGTKGPRPSLKVTFKRQSGTNRWWTARENTSQKSHIDNSSRQNNRSRSSDYTFVSHIFRCPKNVTRRNFRKSNSTSVFPLMIRADNSLGIFMYPYPVGYRIPKLRRRFLGYHSPSATSIPLKIPDPDPNVQSIILNYYGDGFCNGVITHRDFNSKTPEWIQRIRENYEKLAKYPLYQIKFSELLYCRRFNAWCKSVDPNHNENLLSNKNFEEDSDVLDCSVDDIL